MANFITVDIKQLVKKLDPWEKSQLPFATALALTRTAQNIQKAERAAMQRVFDRPTPYTLNSTYVKPATKSNLVAEVSLKNIAQKGQPASVFLGPQVLGGQRQQKRSELLLQQKGILPNGGMWVPGAAASLDRYGNISRGQVQQILSAVHGFGEVGFLANKSFRPGARRNYTTDDIFAVSAKDPVQHLHPGIYIRTIAGVRPLLIFVNHANYKPLLPFAQVARDTYSTSFQDEFNKALRDALILSPSLAA